MITTLFTKAKIPSELPKEMQDFAKKLKKMSSKREVAEQAYEFLSKKYQGHRWKTYTRLFDLFIQDVNRLWSKSGFLHCNHMNYLLRILLIKSGRFKEEDIRLKWTMIRFISPHQYLQVRLENNEFINVDLWGKTQGIALGDYAHGFH